MYWIYQNSPTKKFTVHSGSCGECNNGKGKHQSNGGQNGIWHGNHKDLKSAMKFSTIAAKNIDYKSRVCSKCIGNETSVSKPQPLKLENLICDYEGVYKIYVYVKNKPLKIGRILSSDLQGILYIGQSNGKEGVSSRLKLFLANINNSKSNSHTAGFKIANRKKLKSYLKSKQLYYTCYQDSNSSSAEENELNKYINKFGETPPLNQ